jgi:hypothetical protein
VNTVRLGLEWLVALLVAVVALFLFFNGSALSTWSSLHIDLSINLVAADALRDGVNPYGETVLKERAISLGSPTLLVYNQLFTSYIQPPTSALALLPLTELPWRDATHVILVLNHIFLFAAVGLMLITVRPTLPARWVIAGVALVLMLFQQVNGSFALGQVDATQTLLLVIAFWAYTRDKPAVAGTAIALGAAIKLIPALLLLYFLWRREYKTVAWGAGVGLLLLIVSAAYIGPDIYKSYLTETVPALLKGSSHYANASFGALIARANTPDIVRGLPEMINLNETVLSTPWRLFSAAFGVTMLALVALVIGRRPLQSPRDAGRLLPEFYLVVTAGLIISSVTWEFYVIWLLPAFVAVFVAPGRILPMPIAPRLLLLGAFVLALLSLNFPGDFYLFDDNGFFYRPDWVPGLWAEEHVQLYHTHLDAVLWLRLSALFFTATTFSGLVLWWRFQASRSVSKTRLNQAPALRLPGPQAVEGGNASTG